MRKSIFPITVHLWGHPYTSVWRVTGGEQIGRQDVATALRSWQHAFMDVRIRIPDSEVDPTYRSTYEQAVSVLEGRGVSCANTDGWLVFSCAAKKRDQVKDVLEEMGLPVRHLGRSLQVKVSEGEVNPLERLQASRVFG